MRSKTAEDNVGIGEVTAMLETLGIDSLSDLIERVVPAPSSKNRILSSEMPFISTPFAPLMRMP